MKPDQRWFPTNLVEQAAWFANFAANFAAVGLELRFTQAEIDACLADNEVVQFLARSVRAMTGYERTLRTFQRSMFYDRNVSGVAEFPLAPEIDPPPMVNKGIFERLERLVRRIRTMPEYTDSIGASLGILPQKTPEIELNEFVPKMTILPDAKPYSFSLKFVKGKFKMGQAEINRVGTDNWETVSYFTASPVKITVEPTTPGLPEVLRVRMCMRHGTNPVGRYSSIKTVTVSP
ncbi:MAG: hypothetical protein ACJ72Z_04415 [Pyrinomonadaceae bacterium]